MKKFVFDFRGRKINISEGDIILVHTSKIKGIGDICSPIIRAITKCYYNHAATVVEYLGELYVLEAEARGFNPDITFKQYLNSVGIDREIAILTSRNESMYTQQDLYRSVQFIADKPYGYFTLLVIQPIYQLTGKWLGRTGSKAEKAPVCSQAVAFIYRNLFKKWWIITPSDLWNSRNNYFTLLFESKSEHN